MKKVIITFFTLLLMLIALPTVAYAPCLENDPDYKGIRFWVYFDDDDHPSNCAFAGNGCISCTVQAE